MSDLRAVVAAEVGPLEREAGVVWIHDVELDGASLEVGQQVTVRDGGGQLQAATVEVREGSRWRLRLT